MIKDTYNTLSKRHWLRSIVMPLGWIFHSCIWEYLERANRGQASVMARNHFLTFQSPDNSTEINHKYNQFSQNLGEALEKMSWCFSGLFVMRINTLAFGGTIASHPLFRGAISQPWLHFVLVIYFFVIIYPKLSRLKQQVLNISPWVRHLGAAQSGAIGPRCGIHLPSSCQPWLKSPTRLDCGWKPASRLTQMVLVRPQKICFQVHSCGPLCQPGNLMTWLVTPPE